MQIAQLKIDLKRERNLKDAAKTKTAEMEEEWKEERQRVNDLKMMLERAATVRFYPHFDEPCCLIRIWISFLIQ